VKRVLLTLLLGGCAAVATPHFTGTPISERAPDFTLTNDSGKAWTLSGQHGKVILLFFGYTHCTDTCPDTLAKLGAALRAAGATAQQAQVAFVTVDPERDSPARMHAYVRRFTPAADYVGLTGTPQQIGAIENAYHVYAKAIANDVAHSEFTYIIDQRGQERVVHDDDDTQSAFAADVRTLLR
jgi:protein SCO1